MPSSRSRPRTVFRRAVRVASQPERMRWSAAMDCWGRSLTGTGTIFWFRWASKQSQGIGRVGLVTQAVAADVLGRQQQDPVAEPSQEPAPEVGRAAGLHQNGGRRPIGEEGSHLAAAQPPSLADPARLLGNGNLEHRLCQIHRDGRRMFHGLLLYRKLQMTTDHVGTMMPFTWKEESISSVQRTRSSPSALRSPLTRRPLGG